MRSSCRLCRALRRRSRNPTAATRTTSAGTRASCATTGWSTFWTAARFRFPVRSRDRHQLALWCAAPPAPTGGYSRCLPRLKKLFQQIDSRAARRRFERAAATYADASRLEAEIGVRMLERLDYLKLAPRRILDAGSGPSREAGKLSAKYAGAEVIALDFSVGLLRAGRRKLGFFRKNPRLLFGDLAQLPLARRAGGL